MVVRSDLQPSYQAVQAIHAALDFAVKFPNITGNWNQVSNYLCLLEVPNEQELRKLALKARASRIPSVLFREPDIDNQATALALAPGKTTKELCASLPLATCERSQAANGSLKP